MSATKRNTLVGATVLLSIIVLCWMLLKFGADFTKWFTPPTMKISVTTDRVDGLNEGSAVYYRGVYVGRVDKITRDAKDYEKIGISVELITDTPLPANLEGRIKIISMLSGASQLNLETKDGPPSGKLTENAKLEARFIGSDLFPQEFRELAGNLRDITRQFKDADVTGKIATAADKLVIILDSIKDVVGDETLRKNIKDSVANFRATSENARDLSVKLNKMSDELATIPPQASGLIKRTQAAVEKTEGNIDSITRQVNDRIAQVSKILDSVQSITAKVDKGEGTAGMVVNDPKLYQTLVETSLELKSSISSLKRLIEQWEQEGLSLKLK